MRHILHLDMDAYFASIEQRDYPNYRNKPLIICHSESLSTWRGIVATASYEARMFGIKSGLSVWEAKSLCPHGIFISGNYAKYLYVTRKLVDICQRFSDVVEVFSIDEVFIDLSPMHRHYSSPTEAARRLRWQIRSELGLPVSVGIGPNKLVAKMASDLNKPEGFVIIDQSDLPDILAPLKVESLFGVGRRVGRYLKSIGIATIGELAGYPVEKLTARFGPMMGTALHNAAIGKDSSPVRTSRADDLIKSFGHSSSLGKGIYDLDELDRIILGLTDGVTRRMRRHKYLGRTVTLRLGLDRLLFLTRSQTMAFPTDLSKPIFAIAKDLLRKETKDIGRYPVTLIGVSVSNLIDTKCNHQLSLFDVDGHRQKNVSKVMDSIKNKYGEDCISRGSLLGWHREFQNAPKTEISRPRLWRP